MGFTVSLTEVSMVTFINVLSKNHEYYLQNIINKGIFNTFLFPNSQDGQSVNSIQCNNFILEFCNTLMNELFLYHWVAWNFVLWNKLTAYILTSTFNLDFGANHSCTSLSKSIYDSGHTTMWILKKLDVSYVRTARYVKLLFASYLNTVVVVRMPVSFNSH